MTVVADHDRGQVVWAAKGHGRRQLDDLPGLPADEQRAGIEVVTADGARRVADAVAERLPGAELATGPFHVVSWATDALDGPGREAWREARKAPAEKRRPGRPGKGGGAPDPAREARGLRYPLPENPEDLSAGQESALDALRRAGGALWLCLIAFALRV